MHPELHTWQWKTKTAQSRCSLPLGWRERKSERGSSCWLGWTEPLQRHTDRSLWKVRITCARLFELSHFNPQPGSFGNQLYAPSTQHRAPHPVIQPCRCQHFHRCAAVVWRQGHTHKNTLSPKPPQQLVCLMSVKNARWGGEDGVNCWMLCWSVCLTFLLLFKRKNREIYYLRYLFLRVDYVDALRLET